MQTNSYKKNTPKNKQVNHEKADLIEGAVKIDFFFLIGPVETMFSKY